MPSTYFTPGVYIEEVSTGARPIQAVGTSTAAFIGVAPLKTAELNKAVAVDSWSQFLSKFVPEIVAKGPRPDSTHLAQAVYGFFENGGGRCYVVNVGTDESGKPNTIFGGLGRQGVAVLEEVDDVSIVAAPGYWDASSHNALISHCEKMKDRLAILDPPPTVDDIERLKDVETEKAASASPELHAAGAPATGARDTKSGTVNKPPGLLPKESPKGFATFYYPWITVSDPFEPKTKVSVPPSGHVAGIWARNDGTRGVHKAPANEPVRGALDVAYNITHFEQETLNPIGVNCIRLFSRAGILVWGARTRAEKGSEWTYINVRRLFNMIEKSILQSTRWVVFEPNDRTLWKSIRRDVGAFLRGLWRDGMLMGATEEQAFFVRCDEVTNPPESRALGKVIIEVGVAAIRPAEFVIFRIGQYEAGSEVK